MRRASGRFVLRIDPALHEQLRRVAEREDCSLNQLCGDLLRKALLSGTPVRNSGGIAGTWVPSALIHTVVGSLGNQLEGVVLFGSAARGQMWPQSDIDLLLVLRPDVPITRELYSKWETAIGPSTKPMGRRVSPHFVALPRDARRAGGLWFEVALDGVILWDPQLRVAQMLSSLRQEMAKGAMVRRFAHGHPYWVRVSKSA